MKLSNRVDQALKEARAVHRAATVPPFLDFATEEAYLAAVERGEVPPGIKVYIGIDWNAL
jgi:hypothetical protein